MASGNNIERSSDENFGSLMDSVNEIAKMVGADIAKTGSTTKFSNKQINSYFDNIKKQISEVSKMSKNMMNPDKVKKDISDIAIKISKDLARNKLGIGDLSQVQGQIKSFVELVDAYEKLGGKLSDIKLPTPISSAEIDKEIQRVKQSTILGSNDRKEKLRQYEDAKENLASIMGIFNSAEKVMVSLQRKFPDVFSDLEAAASNVDLSSVYSEITKLYDLIENRAKAIGSDLLDEKLVENLKSAIKDLEIAVSSPSPNLNAINQTIENITIGMENLNSVYAENIELQRAYEQNNTARKQRNERMASQFKNRNAEPKLGDYENWYEATDRKRAHKDIVSKINKGDFESIVDAEKEYSKVLLEINTRYEKINKEASLFEKHRPSSIDFEDYDEFLKIEELYSTNRSGLLSGQIADYEEALRKFESEKQKFYEDLEKKRLETGDLTGLLDALKKIQETIENIRNALVLDTPEGKTTRLIELVKALNFELDKTDDKLKEVDDVGDSLGDDEPVAKFKTIEESLDNISKALGSIDDKDSFNSIIESVNGLDKVLSTLASNVRELIELFNTMGGASAEAVSEAKSDLAADYMKKYFPAYQEVISYLDNLASYGGGNKIGALANYSNRYTPEKLSELFGENTWDQAAPTEGQVRRLASFFDYIKEIKSNQADRIRELKEELQELSDTLKSQGISDNEIKKNWKFQSLTDQIRETEAVISALSPKNMPKDSNRILANFRRKREDINSSAAGGFMGITNAGPALDNIIEKLDEIAKILKGEIPNGFSVINTELRATVDNASNLAKELREVTPPTDITQGLQAGSSTVNISSTVEDMKRLEGAVDEVKESVREKTSLFEEEKVTVAEVAGAESGYLSDVLDILLAIIYAVRDKINEFSHSATAIHTFVGQELQDLEALAKAANVEVNVRVAGVDHTAIVDLNDTISTLLRNGQIPVEAQLNLQSFIDAASKIEAELLDKGNVPIKAEINANSFAEAATKVKTAVDSLNPSSSEFLDKLNEILKKGPELENFANILSYSSKKIDEATKATNSVSNIKTPKDTGSSNLYSDWEKKLKEVNRLQLQIAKANNQTADGEVTISQNTERIRDLRKEILNIQKRINEESQKAGGFNDDEWSRLQALEQQYDKEYKEKARGVAIDRLSRNLNPIENRLNSALDKNLLESDKNRISDLIEELNNLRSEIRNNQGDFNKLSQDVVDFSEKTTQALKDVRAETDQITIDKAIKKVNDFISLNGAMGGDFRKQLEGLRDSFYVGMPIDEFKNLNSQIIRVESEIVRLGKTGVGIFENLSNRIKQMSTNFVAMYFSFYDIYLAGQRIFETVRELDTQLIDLRKTTSMTSDELNEFYYASSDIAKQMGVTTASIIEQASSWSRLGYNTKEASEQMAQLSSQFATISPGMTTEKSQEGLVSIMKAWDIGVEDVEREIMDNINTLGNRFAESNQDIVEGMERSAAALAATGTTYQEAFALFTGAEEVVQTPEVVGRALRSISMRVRGYSENSEDGLMEVDESLKNITGDLIDLTKTAEHTQGVSIFKDGSTTEFKSLVDYFGEIHDIWDEMTQKQQNDFLQQAFGKTQAQAGAAIIQNYEAVTRAMEEMENAAGSSDREMSIARDSIDFKLNAIKEEWTSTFQVIANKEVLKGTLDVLLEISDVLGQILEHPLLSLGGVATGVLGLSQLGIAPEWLENISEAGEKITSLKETYDSVTGILGEFTEAAKFSEGVITAASDATAGLTLAEQAEILAKTGMTEAQMLSIMGNNDEAASAIRTAIANRTAAGAEGARTVTLAGLSAALKEAAASAWLFLTTNPVGWAILAASAIATTAGALDFFTTTAKEAGEEFDKLSQDVEETTRKITDIDSEIQSMKESIDSLNPITDKEQIADLETELGVLEKRRQVLEKTAVLQNKQKAEAAYEEATSGQGWFGTGESYIEEAERLLRERDNKQKEKDKLTDQLLSPDTSPEEYEVILEEIDAFDKGIDDAEARVGEILEILEPGKEAMEATGEDIYNDTISRIGGIESNFVKTIDTVKEDVKEAADESADVVSKSADRAAKSIEEKLQKKFNIDLATDDDSDEIADSLQDSVDNWLEQNKWMRDSNELQKITDWGLGDYYDDIINDNIQHRFGNIDMDKRAIIEWSNELKEIYKNELASWDYDPEVGGIDTVFGGSDVFEFGGQEHEIAFSPILQTDDGPVFLSRDTVNQYINSIIAAAAAPSSEGGGRITLKEILALDDPSGEGVEIGGQFVKGIIAGVDGLKDSGSISAINIGSLMHFTGDYGAIELAGGVEELQEQLDDYEKTAETAAKANLYFENSFNDLSSNLEDYKSVLNKAKGAQNQYIRTSVQFANAISALQIDLKGITGLDFSIEEVEEFLNQGNNFDLLTQAVEGSDEALRALQANAAEYSDIKIDIEAIFGTDEFDADWASFLDWFHSDAVQNAGYLEFQAGLNTNPFIAQLNQALKDGKITAESIQAMFNALGWDVEFDTIDIGATTTDGARAEKFAMKNGTTVEYPTMKVPTNIRYIQRDASSLRNQIPPTAPPGAGSSKSGGSGGGGNGGGSNDKETKKEQDRFKEQYDWIEKRIAHLQRALDKFGKVASGVWRKWTDRSAALNKEINTTKKLIEANEKAAKRYNKQANSLLKTASGKTVGKRALNSKLKENDDGYITRVKLKNGQAYYEDAEGRKQALTSKQTKEIERLQKLFKSGKIGKGDIESITDEAVYNFMTMWEELWQAGLDASAAAVDAQDQLAQEYQEKFDNLVHKYDEKLAEFEYRSSILSEHVSQFEALGLEATQTHISQNQSLVQSRKDELEAEIEALRRERDRQLESGYIEKASEQWEGYQQKIRDTKVELEKCNTEMFQLNKQSRELNSQRFDYLIEKINNLVDESQFIVDTLTRQPLFKTVDQYTTNQLKNDHSLFAGMGQMTDAGITTLGQYGIQYNVLSEELVRFNKRRNELMELFNTEQWNSDLADELDELDAKTRQTSLSMQGAIQNIIDLIKTGVQEEINGLKSLTDLYKNSLDSQKALYDYNKQIREQTTDITSLQKQLSAFRGDNSVENQSRLQTLNKQLIDAQKKLQETETDHLINEQKKMLDNLVIEYSDILNAKFNDTDQVLIDAVSYINEHADIIGKTTVAASEGAGVAVTDKMDAILNTWSDPNSALVAIYGAKDYNSNFNTVNTKLDSAGASLSTLADLGNEQTGVRRGIDNVEAAIRNRVTYSETLASITAKLDSVKDAIEALDLTVNLGDNGGSSGNRNIHEILGLIDAHYTAKDYTKVADLMNELYSTYGDPGLDSNDNSYWWNTDDGIGKRNYGYFSQILRELENMGLFSVNDTTNYTSYNRDETPSAPISYGEQTYKGKTKNEWHDRLRNREDRQDELIDIINDSSKSKGHRDKAKKNLQEVIKQITEAEQAIAWFDKHNYAKGTHNLPKNEFAWTQEKGMEAIIRKSDGAVLTPLKRGDSVLTAAQTENLFQIAKIPISDLKSNLTKPGQPAAISTTNLSTSVGDVSFSISLPSVNDYQSFKREMQNDKQFEKFIRSISTDRIFGGSTLKKFQH